MFSVDLPEVFSIHHPHQPVNLSTSHFLSASGISTEMFAFKKKNKNGDLYNRFPRLTFFSFFLFFLTKRLQFPERAFFVPPPPPPILLRATVAPAPAQAPDTLPRVDGFPHYVPCRLGGPCTVAWCSCTVGPGGRERVLEPLLLFVRVHVADADAGSKNKCKHLNLASASLHLDHVGNNKRRGK